MIPKQLFFIWFGDNKPDYVDFAIKAFKDVNPDFKVDLIWYTINDIENCKDPLLQKCIDISYYKKYNDYQRWTKNSHHRFGYTLRFQEFYRFELLKKYGGIYLDCDMFPIKPFDLKILNNISFCSYTYWSSDLYNRHKDICFFGCSKDFNIIDYNSFNTTIDILEKNFFKNEKWLLLKDKFFNITLKYGETSNNNYYVDHYLSRTWTKDNYQIEKCKYDF